MSSSTCPSLITPCGLHKSSSCGYCKGENPGLHTTWGILTERLTCHDYQYLIDRGWRRSGTYCYKPMNDVTCCPCYTIKCAAEEFHPSRSQRRLLKSVNSYLRTGKIPSRRQIFSGDWREDKPSSGPKCAPKFNIHAKGDVPVPSSAPSASSSFAESRVASGDATCQRPPIAVGDSHASKRERCQKARAKRWEEKLKRLNNRAAAEKRSFEDLLTEYQERRARRLNKNRPKQLESLLKIELDEGEKPAHFIELRLVQSCPRSEAFDDTLQAEYQLFRKYQISIHHEEPEQCTMRSFSRFLIESPLVREDSRDTEDAPQFGSYHQQYWLDGCQLIAVGVVDLLPKCLSAVYLFYDPDYAFLQLGTYSALRELAFVRDLIRRFGPNSPSSLPRFAEFHSYYMGYYIRSCPKMAYKAQFKPSYLACPVTYHWIPVDECLKLLDQTATGKFCRFSPPTSVDPHAIASFDAATDSAIVCRVNLTQRRRGDGKSESKETRTQMSLAQLAPFLHAEGVQLLRELVSLLGDRVLMGHFQFLI